MCFTTTHLFAAVAKFKSDDEERFKAAFIYNFAKFTTWPEASLTKDSSLVLCIAGSSESKYRLSRLSGKLIKGHPLIIKSLNNGLPADKCHMLYIEKSAKNKLKRLLELTRNKAILTISDIPSFSTRGGIIQFYRKQGQTHLIINIDVARESHLEISSRLLILGKVINNEVRP